MKKMNDVHSLEIDIDARKKELREIEQQTKKEKQQLLAMIMEREESLEKREMGIIEKERELRDLEMKLDNTKERLVTLAQKLRTEVNK